MSLRGRYVIDRIKRVVSSHFTLPVPPYGEPQFWDNVYQKMETAVAGSFHPETKRLDFDDSFEWGGVGLADLLQYDYHEVTIGQHKGDYASSSSVGDEVLSTAWEQTLAVGRMCHAANDVSYIPNEPILMLGCGNSKLGEEMIDHGWRGPIVQLDVAKKALDMIARRTTHDSSRLQFVQDDATLLHSIHNDAMRATIDKGLLDALFCADEYRQMADILQSVLRVLRPAGVFCCFSRSRPEFLLPKLLPMKAHAALMQPGKPTWQGLQMQQLESIFLYRFQKSDATGFQEPKQAEAIEQGQPKQSNTPICMYVMH